MEMQKCCTQVSHLEVICLLKTNLGLYANVAVFGLHASVTYASDTTPIDKTCPFQC